MSTEEGSIVAKIKGDPTDIFATFDRVEARAEEIEALSPKVDIRAEATEALAAIETVKAAEKSLGGSTTTTVRIDTVNTGGDSSKTDAETAAEARLAAALAAAESAASRASIAQMRLDELRSSGASSGSRLAAAELAVTESTNRAASAAVKATAATEAYAEAQKQAAAAAIEETAANEANSASEVLAGAAADITNGKIVGMAGGVIALVSTIGPLTGAATGLAGGLAGMGAAGILAVIGIKNEMDQGTATGEAYKTVLGGLKGDLNELASTAAVGFLGSLSEAEQTVSKNMPALNSEIATFTGLLGNGLNSVVDGTINGFEVMNPLFVKGAEVVDNIAESFDEWTHDGGLQQFTQYAITELPIVVNTLGNLTSATVGFGESLGPTGNNVLKLVDDAALLVQGLNSLSNMENQLKGGNEWIGGAVNSIEQAINPIQGVLALGGMLNGVLANLGITTASTADATNSATDANKAQSDALTKTVFATQQQELATQELAGSYHTTVPAYQAAQAAADQQKQSSQQATLQMQLEGDAAGLLTNALTLLNGGTLSLAQAQTGADAAWNSLTDSINKNGTAIDGSSKAAVANQQALQAKVQADQAAAEATAKSTGSTEAGTAAYQASKQSLEDALGAQNMLTPAIQAYIDKIYAIPKDVPTTVTANTSPAQAAIDSYVSANTGRTIVVKIAGENVSAPIGNTGSTSGHGQTQSTGGTTLAQHFASGGTPSGTITGRGSAKSDSVPIWGSVGEEIIQEPYATKFRPELKMINAGIDPYQASSAAVAPQTAASTRPIYADGIGLIGWVKQLANGEAQLVWAQQSMSSRAQLSAGIAPSALS